MNEAPDELGGTGIIIIDGENVETVYYWLAVLPKPGRLSAEGPISGSEQLMRKIRKARAAKLVLADRRVLTIRCKGGRMGVRWIKAIEAQTKPYRSFWTIAALTSPVEPFLKLLRGFATKPTSKETTPARGRAEAV
jgi:hypothetical protein